MRFAPILAIVGLAAAAINTPIATPAPTAGTNGTITGGSGSGSKPTGTGADGADSTSTNPAEAAAVHAQVPMAAGLIGAVAVVLAL